MVSATANQRRDGTWELRLIHRHAGEMAMCPGIEVLRGLDRSDLAPVVQVEFRELGGPFRLEGARCRLWRPNDPL